MNIGYPVLSPLVLIVIYTEVGALILMTTLPQSTTLSEALMTNKSLQPTICTAPEYQRYELST
jgi:hypothetical protein